MADTSPLWFDPSHCLIGGVWRPAVGGTTISLTNPSDGSEICQIARGGAADIDAAVGAAQSAQDGAWGVMSATERGRILSRLAQVIADLEQQRDGRVRSLALAFDVP